MNKCLQNISLQRPVIWWVIVLLFLPTACKSIKEIVPVVPDRDLGQVLGSMRAAQLSFDSFSARFSGRASLDGNQMDIGGSIRIQNDSAILISLAPILGIEVARLLVTPTQVKMLNRLEGTYFEGDMQYVNRLLNADLDYFMLEAILLGNDFSHFSADNFHLSREQDMLLLYSPARRRQQSPQNGTLEHKLWLDPQSFRIMQSQLVDQQTNRNIQSQYPSHASTEGQLVPSEVQLNFWDARSRADLSVRYNRITLNQPQQMTFSIPSRYKPMENQD